MAQPPAGGPESDYRRKSRLLLRWTPRIIRRLTASLISSVLLIALCALCSSPNLDTLNRIRILHVLATPLAAAAPLVLVAEPNVPSPPVLARPKDSDTKRADAAFNRSGRSPIAGGLLLFPPAFASADGRYDLIIHFHGNTELVAESFAVSKINAAVMIMNLGIGSGAYEDRFAGPMVFSEILSRIQSVMEKRGLRGAKRGRLALTAWSAGYGAILKILDINEFAEKVDGVILLDGMHCGYSPYTRQLRFERLAAFERFARKAAHGDKLFTITHSNITPLGGYAGTRVTADRLLKDLGLTRAQSEDVAALPPLNSIDGVLPKKKLRPLEARSEVHQGGLHVRGYAGVQAEQHSMHLVQMSTIALPDLARHWSEATR